MSNIEEGDDLSFEAITFGSGQSDSKPPLHSPSSTDKKLKDQKKNKNKKRSGSVGSPSPRAPSPSTSTSAVHTVPIVTPSSPGIPIANSSSVDNGINIPSSPTSSTPLSTPNPDKPDTILVLKNLPFSLKQDQLEDILKPLSDGTPQSVNLHYEGGVFKGMAFIKYRHIEEAIKVFDHLNGMDVGGRKARVEYKRKNKDKPASASPVNGASNDVPAEWVEDDEIRRIWEQLNEFKTNHTQMELSFAPTLTSVHRKHIHAMADRLKLTHFSQGDDHDRHICVSKKANAGSERRGIDIQGGTRSRGNSTSAGASIGRSFDGGSSLGKSWERERANSDCLPTPSSSMSTSFGRQRGNSQLGSSFSRASHMATSPTSTSPSKVNGFTVPALTTPVGSASADAPLIQPIRQPRGPDGTKGFPDVYRSRRNSPTMPRSPLSPMAAPFVQSTPNGLPTSPVGRTPSSPVTEVVS